MKYIFLLISLLSLLSAKVHIAVSISPEVSLVKNIAGDKVEILTVVPRGASPHNYSPSPSLMTKLQKVDIYFGIGVEFEKIWLKRFHDQNPNLQVIDLSKDIKIINNNPHIWLSTENLKTMAQKVYTTLLEVDPANKEIYTKNLKNYIQALKTCKENLEKKISLKKSKTFMTFHPAFTYFAKEFNLTQLPIEVNGQEPSLKELIKVINKARKNNIHTIITSPEFSDKSAKIIASELDANIVKISPLNPNICETLQSIADNLR